MNQVQHTPGPWVARVARFQDGEPAFGFGIFPLSERVDLPPGIKQHSLASANLYEHSAFTAFFTPGEIEANARLLAAAPDLLAAVQRLMEQPTMSLMKMEPAQRKELWEAHDQARAAIAKATGETL